MKIAIVNLATGVWRDPAAPPPRPKCPPLHTKFRPFTSYQVTSESAKRHGIPRTADGGTHFTSEKQLREYLATEKGHGRAASWKEY